MLKLMDKKIFAILRIYFSLNWPYVNERVQNGLLISSVFNETGDSLFSAV